MASKSKKLRDLFNCDYRDRCLLMDKRIYFECFGGMQCHQARYCALKHPYVKPVVCVQFEFF